MGSSFVALGERGFWMSDGLLELWLRLLALHVEDPSSATPLASPATTIRDAWLLQSRGYFQGCISAGLDDAVATTEGRRLVTEAIERLVNALRKAPPTINGGTLDLLGIEGRFSSDIETARLLEVGQAFLDLIDGKITTDASSTTLWPGRR